MFFGDGPIQVMRFFPSLLFLSPVLLCEAKVKPKPCRSLALGTHLSLLFFPQGCGCWEQRQLRGGTVQTSAPAAHQSYPLWRRHWWSKLLHPLTSSLTVQEGLQSSGTQIPSYPVKPLK